MRENPEPRIMEIDQLVGTILTLELPVGSNVYTQKAGIEGAPLVPVLGWRTENSRFILMVGDPDA